MNCRSRDRRPAYCPICRRTLHSGLLQLLAQDAEPGQPCLHRAQGQSRQPPGTPKRQPVYSLTIAVRCSSGRGAMSLPDPTRPIRRRATSRRGIPTEVASPASSMMSMPSGAWATGVRRSRRIKSRQRFRAIRYSQRGKFRLSLNPLSARNARRKVSCATSRASSSRPSDPVGEPVGPSQRSTSWLKLSRLPPTKRATSSSSVDGMPVLSRNRRRPRPTFRRRDGGVRRAILPFQLNLLECPRYPPP